MSSTEAFTLDSNICIGATLPIFFIALISAVLRRYLATILNSTDDNKTNLEDVPKQNNLARAKFLRAHGDFISLRSFIARRAYFTKSDIGVLCNAKPPPNPLQMLVAKQSDPSAMMSMLKKQFVFLFLSGGMGYLISYLFSGFLVAKAPFPLPYKFKSMLQRGIDVPNMDVTFVSSLSWYFFVLLSSTNLLSLIHHLLGDDSIEQGPGADFSAMGPGMNPAAMMGGGGAAPALPGMGAPDFSKLFGAEKEGLDLMVQRNCLDAVRDKVLKKFAMENIEEPIPLTEKKNK